MFLAKDQNHNHSEDIARGLRLSKSEVPIVRWVSFRKLAHRSGIDKLDVDGFLELLRGREMSLPPFFPVSMKQKPSGPNTRRACEVLGTVSRDG